MALGWRGRLHAWQFDLALATPLSMPTGFKTGHTNLYASATYEF